MNKLGQCPILVGTAIEAEMGGVGQTRWREVEGIPVLFYTSGVGPIQASIETTNLLAARAVSNILPRVLIYSGTAGAYREGGLKVGDVIVCRQSRLVDAGAALEFAYIPALASRPPGREEVFPTDLLIRLKAIIPPEANWNIVEGSVVTVSSIICNDEAATAMYNTFGALAENMECAAVAASARRFDIPFYAAFAISNYVGKNSHEEWRSNAANVVLHSQAVVAALVSWWQE